MLPYILVIFFICASCNAQEAYIIALNKTTTPKNAELYSNIMDIKALSTIQFDFDNVDPNISFIIFQAHSYLYNITMYNYTTLNSTVTGTNVGLYSPASSLATFHVNNPNKMDLKILIAVHGYDDTSILLMALPHGVFVSTVTLQTHSVGAPFHKPDPIPGGCNMEMPVPTAPYLKTQLSPNKDYIIVDGAAPRDDLSISCDKHELRDMTFYRIYLPERDFSIDTYFDGIKVMMNFENIEKIGEVIPKTSKKVLRRTLSAYPGTGSVFVAVATNYVSINDSDVVEVRHSVYVPIVNYACSPLVEEDCKLLSDILSKLLCASLLFLGLFVCYYGHRFFKTEMFIFGMMSGVIITYILISIIAEMEQAPLMGASFLSGILFGFIWLTYWWFYGIPVFAVLLCTLNFGFFSACVLYNQMPGGLEIITEDQNFWTIFLLIMLITSLTLVTATYSANVLCCAILGAYAVIYPIDYCLGSNLKYIIINTVRRATVENFNYAVLSTPYELNDAILTLLWVMLAVTGFLFQHYHNRGKPPFPPPPRNIRERPEVYNYGIRTPANLRTAQTPSGRNTPQALSTNERTPLLA